MLLVISVFLKGEIKKVLKINKKLVLLVILLVIASLYSFLFLVIHKRSQLQEISLFTFLE